MEMPNTTVYKLMTIASARACAIILGLGLALLTNGCSTPPVHSTPRTSLSMIPPNGSLRMSHLLSLDVLFKGSNINAGEKLKKFLEDLGIKENAALTNFLDKNNVLNKQNIQRQIQTQIQTQQSRIDSACGITQEAESGDVTINALLPIEIGTSILIPIIIDKIGEELGEQLEKYSAVYEAKERTTKFYKRTDSPELQSNCLHFSRLPEDKTKNEPLVNLIVQMRVTDNGDALQIRPLRLYQSEAMAVSDDGNYGIAASIRMNAVWRQKNRGMSEEVFNHTFLAERITLSNSHKTKLDPKPVLRYFVDKEWENYPVLPLPPWSPTGNSSKPAGNVEITISMAESGKPDVLLKFIAKLFKSQRKNLAELLKNAAEAGAR